MSELMMNQIQHILKGVNDSLQQMGEQTTEGMDTLLGAVNDLTANILATQAVLAVLVKKYPVDLAEAEAWLKADLGGDVPPATLSVTKLLVTGEKA